MPGCGACRDPFAGFESRGSAQWREEYDSGAAGEWCLAVLQAAQHQKKGTLSDTLQSDQQVTGIVLPACIISGLRCVWMGIHLFLGYVLTASDLHGENLIACGEYLMITDGMRSALAGTGSESGRLYRRAVQGICRY